MNTQKPQITCTKKYIDLPFAHRQPNHTGHCAWLHGHDWSFEFTFAAKELDECGFVVDFGRLKPLKALLEEFDHALVLNTDDPWLTHLKFHLVDATDTISDDNPECRDLANIIEVPDCSAEGLAVYFLEKASQLIEEITGGRATVTKVVVAEDSKNTATAATPNA